jgi:hypothetical protein
MRIGGRERHHRVAQGFGPGGRSTVRRVPGRSAAEFGVEALGFFESVLVDDDAADGLGRAAVDEFA